VEYAENPIPADLLERIFCHTAEAMTELPDRSVHLMVTSPPYNVGKEYDENLSLVDYLAFLERVWKWKEKSGGRIVEQMKADEARHAQTAVDHGGAPLPAPVKWAMRFAADVMRQTASRV